MYFSIDWVPSHGKLMTSWSPPDDQDAEHWRLIDKHADEACTRMLERFQASAACNDRANAVSNAYSLSQDVLENFIRGSAALAAKHPQTGGNHGSMQLQRLRRWLGDTSIKVVQLPQLKRKGGTIRCPRAAPKRRVLRLDAPVLFNASPGGLVPSSASWQNAGATPMVCNLRDAGKLANGQSREGSSDSSWHVSG